MLDRKERVAVQYVYWQKGIDEEQGFFETQAHEVLVVCSFVKSTSSRDVVAIKESAVGVRVHREVVYQLKSKMPARLALASLLLKRRLSNGCELIFVVVQPRIAIIFV